MGDGVGVCLHHGWSCSGALGGDKGPKRSDDSDLGKWLSEYLIEQ
jgi:hypothetical protein